MLWIYTIVKKIKSERNDNSKKTEKLWKLDEDTKIWVDMLEDMFWEEFELTFFRKWVNMLRLWMMTLTKDEFEEIKNRKIWKKENINIEDINENFLEEKEQKLREKIWIDEIKKELEKSRKSWNINEIIKIEIEATNKILKTLESMYPYQLTNNDYGYQPNEILENKEIQCVGFSLIGHVFLSELWINHNWLNMPWHSALEVIIWWKRYYFDPTSSLPIIEFKYWENVWSYRKINLFWTDLIAYSWNTEKIIFSQIYHNKWNKLKLWYLEKKKKLYSQQIILYDKAIKLNPKDPVVRNNKWISFTLLWTLEINPEKKKKLYLQAINIYNEALKLNLWYPILHHNKWIVYKELWNLEQKPEKKKKLYLQAIEFYNKALESSPENYRTYYNKWITYKKLWNKKLWKLNIFASKLLVWKNKFVYMRYKKEKLEIEEFIKGKNYKWLRNYLLSLDEENS